MFMLASKRVFNNTLWYNFFDTIVSIVKLVITSLIMFMLSQKRVFNNTLWFGHGYGHFLIFAWSQKWWAFILMEDMLAQTQQIERS